MREIEIKISNNEIDYDEAVKFMETRVEEINEIKTKELLWFLNHKNIYTQGTSASKNEILKSDILNVITTNRGGKTTYHGPGQRIVYFILNLNTRKKDIRKLISIIENSVISFLDNYNIEAVSFKNRVGIWVVKNNNITLEKEKKIGAIGLRIKRWITYHGMSFNINPNLEYYNYIQSCGLKDYKNTSMQELGIKIDQNEFDEKFKSIFLKNLKNF